MLRFLLCAGLALGVFSSHAEAKTIRYEFDVVSSAIGFQQLYDLNTGRSIVAGTAEYDAFVAAFHSLGTIVGQTGSVVFEIDRIGENYGSLTCTSGFLCADIHQYSATYGVSFPPLAYLSGFGPGAGSGEQWSLSTGPAGGGSFGFFDDGRISGAGSMNGTQYGWWAPWASFTLANLTATDVTVTPVPLPAGAAFLAAGVLALGVAARRRRQG